MLLEQKNVNNYINTKLQTRQFKRFEYHYAQKNVHECTFFCAQLILGRQNEQDLLNLLNLKISSAGRSLKIRMPIQHGLTTIGIKHFKEKPSFFKCRFQLNTLARFLREKI